jgi:hypothetical protein
MSVEEVAKSQREHFSYLFHKYGNLPMATSSESIAHKRIRYEQILECIDLDEPFSIHDVGFGLGAFHDFLEESISSTSFIYSGSEITLELVNTVKEKLPGKTLFHRNLAEATSRNLGEEYDYVVLSGVFHQIQDTSIPEWENYIKQILLNCFSMTNKGLVFNVVSPFVDYHQVGVYYANLSKLLEFITDQLSRFFIIRHNYALFEFTVVVFSVEHTREKFTQPEFKKYLKT